MTDLHCHILPGVDDGPKEIDLALCMLRKEYADGVRNVVLTPHYRRGMFETELETIEEQFEVFQKTAREVCDAQLFLGCEYHANMDMVQSLKKGRHPTIAGSKVVLVEFSMETPLTSILERCHALKAAGYHPIIAHAERYNTLHKLDHLEAVITEGAWIQMNAQSIMGASGWIMARYCHKAIDAQLVHVVASDAHDMKKRPPCLLECARILKKKHGKYITRDLLENNPGEILNI